MSRKRETGKRDLGLEKYVDIFSFFIWSRGKKHWALVIDQLVEMFLRNRPERIRRRMLWKKYHTCAEPTLFRESAEEKTGSIKVTLPCAWNSNLGSSVSSFECASPVPGYINKKIIKIKRFRRACNHLAVGLSTIPSLSFCRGIDEARIVILPINESGRSWAYVGTREARIIRYMDKILVRKKATFQRYFFKKEIRHRHKGETPLSRALSIPSIYPVKEVNLFFTTYLQTSFCCDTQKRRWNLKCSVCFLFVIARDINERLERASLQKVENGREANSVTH